MREYLEIVGGVPLRGTVAVSGAKNAALPMLIASLLTPEECTFRRVPNLEDTNLTVRLLEHFGSTATFSHSFIRSSDLKGEGTGGVATREGVLTLSTPVLRATEASYSLVKALRASFWVLAPLLARGRAARVALPGGDIIGARPVDLHLAILAKMGAEIQLKQGVVFATAVRGLRPVEFDMRFPSVGATHQFLMAAALTPGTSVLRGAAREPEVVALAEMLSQMGASIEGAGTPTIIVRGCEGLRGASVDLIGDRIEAGTYLLAGVATGGDLTVEGVEPAHLGTLLNLIEEMGGEVYQDSRSVRVRMTGRPRAIRAVTAPYPGFATDLQAPLMAALACAEGTSLIEETIFEGRFGHVAELGRMGASITVEGSHATIHGVAGLSAAPVEALDIRAGAALVIAALAASGRSEIHELHHLRRGYQGLADRLRGVGAQVLQRVSDAEDFAFSGC